MKDCLINLILYLHEISRRTLEEIIKVILEV